MKHVAEDTHCSVRLSAARAPASGRTHGSRAGIVASALAPCACARICNQRRFGTLQEVINSQDYCADAMISKVLHNSLCGKGWLNQSTWKRERDVRFAASCRGPSASLPALAVSLLCEEEGVWTSKSSHATLETETISKRIWWRLRRTPFHDSHKYTQVLLGSKGIPKTVFHGEALRELWMTAWLQILQSQNVLSTAESVLNASQKGLLI